MGLLAIRNKEKKAPQREKSEGRCKIRHSLIVRLSDCHRFVQNVGRGAITNQKKDDFGYTLL